MIIKLIRKVGFSIFFVSFFFQKVLRLNGKFKYLIHFTSRVRCPDTIFLIGDKSSLELKSCLLSSIGIYIQGKNKVYIDYSVYLAPGVKIISANHDSKDLKHHIENTPIKIKENVWLGANVTILPGVEIGRNSIIGAGSIVTKSVPANVVAVGNPCRVIKSL